MTPEEIGLLYDYNAWANHRILDACAGLSEEQMKRRIESSFPSLRETLLHIVAGEWIWLERWRGRSHSKAEWDGLAQPLTSMTEIRAFWSELERKQKEFIGGLTPERLSRAQDFRTLDGTPYSQPLWQMMQHLVNHGTYHRGQVTTMLRQLGAKPVSTDLIAFYRQRAAAAR